MKDSRGWREGLQSETSSQRSDRTHLSDRTHACTPTNTKVHTQMHHTPAHTLLSISPYVQRLTLHWITLSTLLMMAHKAETAVQGWSVDPMEAVILTHRVLAARSTVRLSESLAVGKSFSLVLWSLVVMVTAQASVVILLSLHPQARG